MPAKKDFAVEQPSSKDLIKDHRFIGLHRQMPGEKEIQEILRKMGKNTPRARA